MDFDKVVRKRASIRSYSIKKVKVERVIEALQTANLAPSPGNLPIIYFLVVQDYETIKKIADACRQYFLEKAPYLVVVCSDPKRAGLEYEERADRYIKQHAGAVIENLLLKLTDMGLASCWIGAFSDMTIKHILDIPDNINIEAILPVAYQYENDHTKQKTKHELDARIYFDKWKNKYQKPLRKVRMADV